jgi:putative tryptophan/tyrosine transport system substrate-binding protein
MLTTGTEAALAAKEATQRIPIVMGFSGHAVQLGTIADLARPGGNITEDDLSQQRVEWKAA